MGPFRNFHVPWNDAAGMIDTLDAYAIDVALVAPHAAISSDPLFGNRLAGEAAAANPGRLYAYYTVNPFYDQLNRLEIPRRFGEPWFKGFKVHPELHGDYPLEGDGYTRMWRFAADRQLPVLSHTYFGGDRLEVFARLATEYPSVPILVGHLAFDLGLDNAFRLADEHANIYLDLTGPLRWNGVVERVVTTVGADRVVYGSDIPFLDPGLQLGAIVYSTLSEKDADQVLGGTANYLFRLVP
jgi:uncharacterized protein